MIDYACGSGHFLTEGIDILNSIHESDDNDWVQEKIFGIEKDYRLARVSKISLFMNGAGGGNIIFGDGLDNHKEKGIENSAFDILVANPPYSVKAFKSHLQLEDNEFELINLISNEGSEIEVLFVERISQLVKPNGVAAVILPSSLLSNTSNSYTGAREVILKNFKIQAIAQFNDKTFGATGTNTVVLFLKKYNEPPKHFKMMEDSIQAIFSLQTSKEWKDDEILNDYVDHIGVDISTYSDFLEEKIDYDDWEDDEYFSMYLTTFINSTEFKNMSNRNSFKRLDIEEQNPKLNAVFYAEVKEIEREKLFYFSLIRENETLVIKAPSSASGQYEYLGYQWSNRKGSEGIQIRNLGGMLYDTENRESEKHISPLIRKAFDNELEDINEDLEKYAIMLQTKNMLDFDREKFDKTISLIEKEVIKIISKYPVKPLGSQCHVLIGGTPSRRNASYFQGENLWVSIAEMNGQVINNTKEKITDLAVENSNVKLIPKNTTLLSFKLSIGKTAIAGRDLYTNEAIAGLVPKGNDILDKYLFFLFKGEFINLGNYIGNKAFGKSLNRSILSNDVKIPVPPIEIQEKIIEDCEKVENRFETTRMEIEEYQKEISKIFEELEVVKSDGGGYRLSDSKVFSLSIGKRVLQEDLTETGIHVYSANVFEPMGLIDEKLLTDFDNEYIVWGIDGDWMVNIFPKGYEFYPTDHCGVMQVDKNIINPRYMAYLLKKEGARFGFSRTYRASLDRIKNISIEVPHINTQNEKMREVENLEKKIRKLEKTQIDLNSEISNIIDSYLI